MTIAQQSALKIRQWPWLRAALRPVVLFVSIGGIVLLLLVLAGVFHEKVPLSDTGARPAATVPAAVDEVRLIHRQRMETAVGTVQPVHEAAVASKLLARVVEVRVRAGQAVQESDVLVRLDDADLQARLKQAEAAHASAEAGLQRATQDHERAERLIAQRTISQQEYDAAVAALRSAKAEVNRAQEAVNEAKVLLDFATLRAPLSGIVIDKRVETGDTAIPGQVLVTLFEPNRMQMVTTVRESLALRLKVGDQVPARLDALDHECLATVSEIVPEAESASRSFTVKVTGPCPPGAYSGMFGRISIPLDEEEVVVVPSVAVFRVGQLAFVEVVDGDDIRRRSVQLGRKLSEGYEVLAGLKPGESVVLRRPAPRVEDQ